MKKVTLLGMLVLAALAVQAQGSVIFDSQIIGFSQRKAVANEVAAQVDFNNKIARVMKNAESKAQADEAVMQETAGGKLTLQQRAQIEEKKAMYAMNMLVDEGLLEKGFVEEFASIHAGLAANLNSKGKPEPANHVPSKTDPYAPAFRSMQQLASLVGKGIDRVMKKHNVDQKMVPVIKNIANHPYYVYVDNTGERLLSVNDAAAFINEQMICFGGGYYRNSFDKWEADFYKVPADRRVCGRGMIAAVSR